MADKLTQQIVDALSRAAAEPDGLPLYAAKAEPGLFPSTSAAKPAAQKCLTDELVRITRTETKGKTTRELYGLTEKGWEYLLAGVNPKQVLEDFVRVLEARQGEVGELLTVARHMAASLHGLKEAVARVLPRVGEARVRETVAVPSPPVATGELGAGGLEDAILTRLADWSGSAHAGEDCPLPELFRSLSTREPVPTIGEFHDCLRQLHDRGAVYLHSWTGPLYALPEPAYALLVGHGIAFYASLREPGLRNQRSGVRVNPAFASAVSD